MAEELEKIDFHEDDEPFSQEELSYFRRRLLNEREKVKRNALRHMKDAVGEVEKEADELDQAVRLSDQAFLMRLADKEQKLLRQIEKALKKFAVGEYGVCEGTGELIGRKRLDLRPWTRYSITYKEQLERDRGKRHRR